MRYCTGPFLSLSACSAVGSSPYNLILYTSKGLINKIEKEILKNQTKMTNNVLPIVNNW